jgi:hypothetical protein
MSIRIEVRKRRRSRRRGVGRRGVGRKRAVIHWMQFSYPRLFFFSSAVTCPKGACKSAKEVNSTKNLMENRGIFWNFADLAVRSQGGKSRQMQVDHPPYCPCIGL